MSCNAYCIYLSVFYGFRSDVGSGDSGSAQGSYGLLKETLLSLMTMEQISLGSVF